MLFLSPVLLLLDLLLILLLPSSLATPKANYNQCHPSKSGGRSSFLDHNCHENTRTTKPQSQQRQQGRPQESLSVRQPDIIPASQTKIKMEPSLHNDDDKKKKKRNAVVLLDPLTDWRDVLNAVKSRETWYEHDGESITTKEEEEEEEAFAIAVICNPLHGRDDIAQFIPTKEVLMAAGFDLVIELPSPTITSQNNSPPPFAGFDAYSCALELKSLEQNNSLSIRGIVPLAETAVEYSDTLSALLGLSPHHNELHTVLARRDKGFMKQQIMSSSSSLRVAKFGRVQSEEQVPMLLQSWRKQEQEEEDKNDKEELTTTETNCPIAVVKTPQGFSTTDVYICHDENEVKYRVRELLKRSFGPDCRSVNEVLVEEYIGGVEFAVNVVASPFLVCEEEDHKDVTDKEEDNIAVTDIWMYSKTNTEGTARYDRADMMDPTDTYKFGSIMQYATSIAKAVGIKYGMGHVELKAKYCTKSNRYVDPVLIEVGARLSGGRKAILTRDVVQKGWDPFRAIVRAHCGLSVKCPSSFSLEDEKRARHLFLPYSESGTVTEIVGGDIFDSLETRHAHFVLAKVGDVVQRTTDIVTNGAFVWLVGTQEDIDRDTEIVQQKFRIRVE